MSSGFAFALLLTLQSLQLVSTETGELITPLVNGIPDEWKRESSVITPAVELRISSGSMTFSGDDEYQAANQNVTAVTRQYDDDGNTTLSSQTPLNVSSNPTKTNKTSIQKNNTSDLVTPNPYLGSSVTSNSHVNLTETYNTTPNPGNSITINTTTTNTTTTNATTTNTTTTNTTTTNTTTTNTSTANATTTSAPAFNITQTSASAVSGNFTTTSPPQVGNYTDSPRENSTNTTVFTTATMDNHTSVVLLNESSTASITTMNATGGPLDVRGILDKGLSSDIEQKTQDRAWGVILGIGVGVAIVALVVYIIVKRRNSRDFSHRKLVEDMPPEPVLRLDHSEPLDLKFNGFAYYNRGLQGDSIQMTNFPRGQNN
ncbi:mucin-15 [Neoarius graeffei]|uniref:mucin-15 n=1 Tax=Neoarius graeffei TaxID=443677 RepID=UPI00298D463E|nr:mucin-15 [Neoarius graeffei]